MEVLQIVLDAVIIVIGILIVGYLKEIPVIHKELTLQKNDHEHKHKLQQEAYYKQVTGENMESLFKQWTEYFVDMDKLQGFDRNAAMELAIKVFMYGSSDTVKLFSIYMNGQFNDKIGNELQEYSNQYQLYIFADLLSHLKYDFTGYKVDPLDFLKSKITDYDIQFTDEVVKIIRDYINNQ